MRPGEAGKPFSSRPRIRVVFFFVVFLLWSCFLSLRCEAQTLVPEEVAALKTIGAKLGKQWDFTVEPCSGAAGWVDPTSGSNEASNVTCTCNATSCHVVVVQLKGQNLTGVLPPEFARLTSLATIDLTRNYLNGSIPAEWATLPLTNLSLPGNRISGSIPEEFGNISTLTNLVLQDNLLQGPIPSSLGKLTNLNYVNIVGNNISGELPESLGNLKNITDFRIDGNPISGKIPSFIGKWTRLNRLDMEGTAMEGPIPPIFSTLTTVTELRITDMGGGDGKFPPLQNMIGMTRLVLRNMSISDSLPGFIGQMPKLKTLDLSFNNLTGPIPDNYATLVNSINYLYFTDNKLNGSIPDWIMSSNKNLDLSYNTFTGSSVPSSCQKGNVNLVSSYSSTDSNSIATCLRKNLPCSGKATNFQLFINCGGGKVTISDDEYEADTSTDASGASTFHLAASGNWAYSSTGDFIDNHLEVGYLATNVSVLNVTNPELYTTARLSPLSLKYHGLCLQNGNYTVNLHFSEIMFTNNHTFASVGRRLFDVSIQGKKVLRDFNIAQEANGVGRVLVRNFTTIVDDNTLEIHFQWGGKGTHAIPFRNVYGPLISAIAVTPNFEPDMGGSKLSSGAIAGIVIGASMLVALVIIFIWFCFIRRDPEDSELRGLDLQGGLSFSLRQIKAATRNFDAANKIGEGGFGPVYKGVLSDGTVIAVKQLSSKSKQGNREFINEVGMISALQHPNLVKLFGCCIEGNQLLLIYEYMENNCLARVLFGPERSRIKLDWPTRRKICLGIARGLVYLHEESRLKIVHRDIKATNVLLDKDLNAKISDFGLARLSEEEDTHISTRIAGTRGYMAPEYAMRGYLTDKADVYSFGVVLLEIVSGRSNMDYKAKDDLEYLLDRACVLQERGELLQLVDESLGSNYSKEEALQILNLALICTNISPAVRPSMSTVVSILDGKRPMPVPFMGLSASVSGTARSTAVEGFSNDSRRPSIWNDGPWVDSSGSAKSRQEEHSTNSSTGASFCSLGVVH